MFQNIGGSMLRSKGFSNWLTSSITESSKKKYRHQLLKENVNHRLKIGRELKLVIQKAHEDVRRHLRDIAGQSLDPLGSVSQKDPAEGYPSNLEIKTLKGYFGEVFAGIIAENFAPFQENDWKVPAFLFRFHTIAFQQLELLKQTGVIAKTIPGRTGDDCLAFKRDNDGNIIKSLVCEAKCTADHDSKMISQAHEKISEKNVKPVDLLQLVAILLDYKDQESLSWVNSLRQLYFKEKSDYYERYDLVCYLCGRFPVQKNRYSWIPSEKPHDKYKGNRKLEAVEVHLPDITKLILYVYDKEDGGNGTAI